MGTPAIEAGQPMRRIHSLFKLISGAAVAGITFAPAGQADATVRPQFPVWAADLARAICEAGRPAPLDLTTQLQAAGKVVSTSETVIDSETMLGLRFRIDEGGELQVTVRLPGAAGQRVRITYAPPPGGNGDDLFAQTGPDCRIDLARIVERDDTGRPQTLVEYAGDKLERATAEPLNPEVPQRPDPGGVAVATIDTGIAYTLPQIAGRLARDSGGRILGHDFHDGDDRPFDIDPSRPAVFPIRHGTAVASILLREAPDARLVPLRYPAGAPEMFAAMVEHIAAGPARIVAMPLGGARRDEWEPFAAAARRHPEILFVVSAGNDGRDIDAKPIYPAGFGLDNVLVVTSTDAFGRLAAESNWGARTVHVAVPGERIDVVDHRGAAGKASGSSYAVPRVAALAARMKARDPEWDAAAIKSAILGLAVPLGDASRPVAAGWIPNPAIE